MLSYPITGVREGTLQAERDGLYWNVRAACSRDWDYPIRLLAETDGVRTILGVPQPEPDGLRLQIRSRRGFLPTRLRNRSQNRNPHRQRQSCFRLSRRNRSNVFRSFPS